MSRARGEQGFWSEAIPSGISMSDNNPIFCSFRWNTHSFPGGQGVKSLVSCRYLQIMPDPKFICFSIQVSMWAVLYNPHACIFLFVFRINPGGAVRFPGSVSFLSHLVEMQGGHILKIVEVGACADQSLGVGIPEHGEIIPDILFRSSFLAVVSVQKLS